jgi:hypothetical protein
MLNLFIAIIVNVMQSYIEKEHHHHLQAIQDTQAQVKADVCDEVRWMRGEIAETKDMRTTALDRGTAQ